MTIADYSFRLAQDTPPDLSNWFDLTPRKIYTVVALLAGWLLLRKVRNFFRRRRPPTIHPKLQKYGQNYGEPDEKMTAQRRAEAEKIVATSTTATIVGYEIIEQVEAVYVDGFRKPEDAIEGLKATAAMKGANAVTNVQQQRSSAGICAANGDAVIVQKISEISANRSANPTPKTDKTT